MGEVLDMVGGDEEVHAVGGVDFDAVAEDLDGGGVEQIGNPL